MYVEKETKNIKGTGKGMVIKLQKFYLVIFFADLSYLCYSLDFPKLSGLESYRKQRRKMNWEQKWQTLDFSLDSGMRGSHRGSCMPHENGVPITLLCEHLDRHCYMRCMQFLYQMFFYHGTIFLHLS